MMVQSRPQQNNLAQETKCGKNQSHTLAYSLIGLQEMNLAFKFPIMFWNCACLISDAGGNEEEETEEEEIKETSEVYYNEMVEFSEDDSDDDVSDEYDEEDCDGYPATVCVMKDGKKKKKVRQQTMEKLLQPLEKSNNLELMSPRPTSINLDILFHQMWKEILLDMGLAELPKSEKIWLEPLWIIGLIQALKTSPEELKSANPKWSTLLNLERLMALEKEKK